jgi:hypothetical protein
VDVYATTDAYSGATAARIKALPAGLAGLISQAFVVRANEKYVLDILSKSSVAAGGGGTHPDFGVNFYDDAFADVAGSDNSGDISFSGDGVWTKSRLTFYVPDGAHYARVYFESYGSWTGVVTVDTIEMIRIIEDIAVSITTTAEAYTAPTLLNSWANFGGGYAVAAYKRDPSGNVWVKGTIKTGTAGTTAFTLPTGYRPAATMQFAVNSYDGAANNPAWVDVDSSGHVIPQYTPPGGGNISINLSFAV